MIDLLIDTFIQMLVIINPFSKIVYILDLREDYSKKELLSITLKSNTVAFLILLTFTMIGTWLLRDFFHIELAALKIAGGIIVAKVGYEYAVIELEKKHSIEKMNINEISATPLGIPLIAGPGAITLAITLSYSRGILITAMGAFMAIIVNGLIMAGVVEESSRINKIMIRVLAKIVGIFILALGIQMVLMGVKDFMFEMLYSKTIP